MMRVVQGLLSQGIVMDQHELWYRCVSAITGQTVLYMHKAYQPLVTDGWKNLLTSLCAMAAQSPGQKPFRG